jgi:phosphopantothenoylcysteine decarboxylase/phosphopantothenate--cysteine ligase
MKFIITAGPTREHIDPVRFLSNPSTGKMGFAVAAEAARRGHETVLVAGPVSLRTPPGVRRIDVVSARDMLAAVKNEVIDGAVFVGVAAVADFRPAVSFNKKQKKSAMTGELKLVRNPDILKSLKSVPITRVGFAAETNDVLAEASRKCREKKLKFIVANDVLAKGSGFGVSTNRVTFVYPDGSLKKFPLMSKRRVAERILDEIDRA